MTLTMTEPCGTRPLFPDEGAVMTVECDGCGRTPMVHEALSVAGDNRAPWRCAECALCSICGTVLYPGVIIAAHDDDQAPWVHRFCIVECDGCGVRMPISSVVAAHDDNRAPWLCEGCRIECDECGVASSRRESIAIGDDDDRRLCSECALCAVCGHRLARDTIVARDDDDQAPWVHAECLVECGGCGRSVVDGEAIDSGYGGDDCSPWLCWDCLGCSVCHHPMEPRHAISIGDDGAGPWLCAECAVCVACGAALSDGEGVAQFADGCAPWLCAECADGDDGDDGTIHDYSYTPPCWTVAGGPVDRCEPTMGIELEIEAQDGLGRFEIVKATAGAYPSLMLCKSDGSLGGDGVEVVTHPMTIKYAQEFDWPALLAELAKHGSSWDTSTCGLHVHLSRASMSTEHLWRFGALLHSDHRQLQRFAGRCGDQWAVLDDDWASEGGRVVRGEASRSRYHALNLCPEDTVEVRIFRGTLAPQGVLGAIEMVHAMWAYTADDDAEIDWTTWRRWVEAGWDYPTLAARLNERCGQLTTTTASALAAA